MNINEQVIKRLKLEVDKSYSLNEIPVGAVIFDSSGNIISSGHNTRQFSHNVLGHAEINAILNAEKVINDWRLDGYYMLVSLKPCQMCSSVIAETRLNKVFYFLDQENIKISAEDNYVKLDIDSYYNEYSYFKDLLTTFFDNMR